MISSKLFEYTAISSKYRKLEMSKLITTESVSNEHGL